jgi:hypothetical protein
MHDKHERDSHYLEDVFSAQEGILCKVAEITPEGLVVPIKFPEIKMDERLSPEHYHIIIIDMRGFNAGDSGLEDYLRILYGDAELPEDYKRTFSDENGRKFTIKGIFDPSHPDPRCKYLQERIHGVGFAKEKEYKEGALIDSIVLYHNPRYFESSDELRKEWKKLWNKK